MTGRPLEEPQGCCCPRGLGAMAWLPVPRGTSLPSQGARALCAAGEGMPRPALTPSCRFRAEALLRDSILREKKRKQGLLPKQVKQYIQTRTELKPWLPSSIAYFSRGSCSV